MREVDAAAPARQSRSSSATQLKNCLSFSLLLLLLFLSFPKLESDNNSSSNEHGSESNSKLRVAKGKVKAGESGKEGSK